MPLYFFNVLNDVRTNDQVGSVLDDLERALVEAQKDIRDILRQHYETLDNNKWTSWSIEICDESGNVLLVVPFVAN